MLCLQITSLINVMFVVCTSLRRRSMFVITYLVMPCPFTLYRSQNVLCQSKYFEPASKFSAPSKPFVLAQKPILQNANHLFVWHKKFATTTICKYFFVLAHKIWTTPKHFGTCKRTRHISLLNLFVPLNSCF